MRLRAFTLIELVVALAIGVAIIATITTLLASVARTNRRQRIHSELQRDADFVNTLLRRELRQAGLGVPTGPHLDPTYGTAPQPVAFDVRRILVAAPAEIEILGDIARPEVTYPAFGTLSTNPTGAGRNSICWNTENNGTCCRTATDTCSFANASEFFPTNATSCASGNFDRTCPWYGRLLVNDRIQIVDGSGTWTHEAVGGSLNAVNGANSSVSLGLSFAWNPAWTNTSPGDPPGGTLGQGFVTSLDRITYRFDAAGKRILRRQCVGDPDPNATNWPPPSATAVPASLTVNPTGSSATNCLAGEETVARNVTAFALTYFDDTSTAVVNPNSANLKNKIRRIEWSMTMGAPDPVSAGAPDVIYETHGAVTLQNVQGGEP